MGDAIVLETWGRIERADREKTAFRDAIVVYRKTYVGLCSIEMRSVFEMTLMLKPQICQESSTKEQSFYSEIASHKIWSNNPGGEPKLKRRTNQATLLLLR